MSKRAGPTSHAFSVSLPLVTGTWVYATEVHVGWGKISDSPITKRNLYSAGIHLSSILVLGPFSSAFTLSSDLPFLNRNGGVTWPKTFLETQVLSCLVTS